MRRTDGMARRSIPVCFTKEQLKKLEEYGRQNGTLNSSQALEKLIKNAQT